MVSWCRSLASVLLCLALLPGLGRAAGGQSVPPPTPKQDSLSALVDLLAERGLITAEEQAELKKRAEQTPKPAPPEAPRPTYPTVKTKFRLQARWSAVQEDNGQPYFGDRDDQAAGGDGFAVRRARLHFLGELSPKAGYTVQYQADDGT